MADRERSGASTRAALALLALPALVVLLRAVPGCTGEVPARAGASRPGTPGLTAAALAPRPVRVPAPAVVPAVDPARARDLTARFRARIAHWTSEAGRLSKGQATAANVRVAACVRAVGTRGELVALRGEALQPPASNQKLVTTAAALILLGRDAQWVTPFEAAGEVVGGTLRGDLVVRAAGDPLVDAPGADGRSTAEARVRAVARAVRAAGVTRVTGDLVLDEGSFAPPAPGPAWPDATQHWAEYCALSGGFSANGGVLRAVVTPRSLGQAAAIAVHPSPHGLKTSYDVRTVAGTAVDVRVGATATTATVKGALGRERDRGGPFTAEFAHPDPVAHFGALVAGALGDAGVVIEGGVRRARGVPRGRVLAELRSPLADTLEPINAESRNGVADQLFLSLGHALGGAGTRAGAARAVGLALARLELPAEDLRVVDGSGLSRDNRVTARAIAALLEGVLGAEPETARLYRTSLAVMGRKGTLSDRLRGTAAEGRVFAKTGWIAGVSTLSGYVEPATAGARPLVFSILIEYPSALGGLNTSCFKKLQDELVQMLVEDRT
jgi:D-alanyl-D-alanine carboxypeptidase/D-alanyl-D-alanine-endopeptidase (penicillin-binding protein 4)